MDEESENKNTVQINKKKSIQQKLEDLCGFELKDITSWDRFVRLMYRPTDPSSLGITRLLFGLLMVTDIPEERGGSELDIKWGETRDCHFPLFNFLRPLPLPYMGLLYGLMWIGAIGIMLGYKFRLSIIVFTIAYWYLFLLDKSYWNNHSYLFGLVSILLLGSSANHYCSVDGLLNPSIRDKHVPLWNYFILKYQFFMLYFLAGLKKSDVEWLEGYAMTKLGNHWVFDPFKFILTTEQIDFLIVHWFGFIFDLTVGFWLLYDLTRPYAMIFCASFHVMNSRLFSIGMFPYVCLATMPLFCDVNWPRKIYAFLTKQKLNNPGTSESCIYESKVTEKKLDSDNNTEKNTNKSSNDNLKTQINWKHKLVACLLLTHCGLQVFLPYSHFITKGYNNWVQGLYGYSWDMMVHSWNTVLVVIKVVDNKTGREHFLEPGAWTQNDRWTKHADMCVQYAQCLKKNLLDDLEKETQKALKLKKPSEALHKYISSEDISIYIDVWCSLNKRFQQRMFNPNYDLLKANWSPFQNVEWLMPLLTQYNDLRHKIWDIQQHVYSWSNYSDVFFVADFPGLYLENYITPEMRNITLTVLEGEVYYETDNKHDNHQHLGTKLLRGASTRVRTGVFHRVRTLGSKPACYMYTYVNRTREINGIPLEEEADAKMVPVSPFPILEDTGTRLERLGTMLGIIGNSFLNVVYNVPMLRRSRVF